MDAAAPAAVAAATATVAVVQPETKATSSADTSSVDSKTTSATTDTSHVDTSATTASGAVGPTGDGKTTSVSDASTTGSTATGSTTTGTTGTTSDATKTTAPSGTTTGITTNGTTTGDGNSASGAATSPTTTTDGTGSNTASALGTATSDPTASKTTGTTATSALGTVDALGLSTTAKTAADLTGGTLPFGTTAEGPHVLAIASTVSGAEALAASASKNVITTIYDAQHDTLDQVLDQIHSVLGDVKAASIALATTTSSLGDLSLTDHQTVTADNLLSQPEVSHFFEALGSMIADGGRLDLLSCDITVNDHGVKLVQEMEQVTHHEVAASSDRTGNTDVGGDWQLETGNVDAAKTYFDAVKLADYHGALDGAGFVGGHAPTDATVTVETGVAGSLAGGTAIQVSDADLTGWGDYTGSTMTINRTDGANGADTFDVDGSGHLSFAGGDLVLDGTQIGTYTNAGGSLVLNFDGGFAGVSVTQANVNDALSHLTYRNNTAGSISLTWLFDDGTGLGTQTATGDQTVYINKAPTLGGDGAFSGITEDQSANAGQAVSAIVNSAGNITDTDGGAVKGIAVYGASVTGGDGSGAFEYSTNNGTTWTAVNDGSLAAGHALLLRDTDLVRFIPDTHNGCTAELQYYAWDQSGATSGQQGTYVSVTGIGTGTEKPFSTATGHADVTVSDVNDAPALTGGVTHHLTSITEDQTTTASNTGQTVASMLAQGGSDLSDADASASSGIAVYAQTPSNGHWQYCDGGLDNSNEANWHIFEAAGALAADSALLLRSTDFVRFVPDGHNSDSASFNYAAWDQTSGVALGRGDTSSNGGTTAFSSNHDTTDITVTAVNDAPVVATNSAITVFTDGNTLTAGGETVSTLLGANSDTDRTDVISGSHSSAAGENGIAVQWASSDNGVWQYKDAGNNWVNFGAVTYSNALLLNPDDPIRFVPTDATENTRGALTFSAWDRSQGGAGTYLHDTYVNLTTNTDLTRVVALDTITEKATTSTMSIYTVADLVGPVVKVNSDLSITPVDGVAIHGVSGAAGAAGWQYYSNETGAWVSFDHLGALSDSNALLLKTTDSVRYNTEGGAAPTFDYYSWDPSVGAAHVSGDTVNASDANRGLESTKAFGLASDHATITVSANSGETVSALLRASGGASGLDWKDVDSGTANMGIAITGVSLVNPYNGTGGDASVHDLVTDVAGNPTATLSKNTGAAGFEAQVSSVIDPTLADKNGVVQTQIAINFLDTSNGSWKYSTTGAAGTWVDFTTLPTDKNGWVLNTTDYVKFTPTVVGLGGNTTNASFIYEAHDGGEAAGTAVYSFIAGPKTLPTEYNGKWQYSTNGGITWTNITNVSNTNALLLAPNDRVRFIPDGHNGTVATLTYRLWDQSNVGAVNHGEQHDVSANGGSTAYSDHTGAAEIVATSVNDAPMKTIMVYPEAMPPGTSVQDQPINTALTFDMDLADNPESRLTYTVVDKPDASHPYSTSNYFHFTNNQMFQTSALPLPASVEWHYQVNVTDQAGAGGAVDAPRDASANGYFILRSSPTGEIGLPVPLPVLAERGHGGNDTTNTITGDTGAGTGGNSGFVGNAGGPGGPVTTTFSSSFSGQDTSWFDTHSNQYIAWDSGNRYQGDNFTRGNFDLGTLGGAAADVLNRLQALAMGGALADIFGGGDKSPAEAVQAAKQVLNEAIETMDFNAATKTVLHGTNDMILDLVLLSPGQDALNEAQLCISSLSAVVNTVFGGDSSPLAQRMVTVWVNILNKILQDLAANGNDTSQAQQQLDQIKQSISQ